MSDLLLYDTKAKKKKIFRPRKEVVQIYVCGPTVYDRAHVGNARSVVVFDLLYRVLKSLYSKVRYVRNITDIDDKIIVAARNNKEEISTLTRRTLDFFHKDMGALGAMRPTHEPLATQYVPHMVKMIETLINKKYAYVVNGHVMFHVKHYNCYGSLSRRTLEKNHPGARIAVNNLKRDPNDFVLWKPSDQGEPSWESPWGYGRPGWHIECSAMSHAFLDVPFDIHGGGQDLIFPHHENEQAQSCCSLDTEELAYFWMHNGILTVDGEKMSKSLGNIVTVPNALKSWSGEVIRWALLSTHYRQPLDWNASKLHQAKENLARLNDALCQLPKSKTNRKKQVDSSQDDAGVREALLNDLNTPLAFSKLRILIDRVFSAQDTQELAQQHDLLLKTANLMGFGHKEPGVSVSSEWRKGCLAEEKIELLIQERQKAKQDKNYAQADAIRDELKSKGIFLEDTSTGTTWRYV